MGAQCGYKNPLGISGCRLDQRTAPGDLAGHDHQSRTRKTMRFVLLALVLNRNYPPLLRTIESVAKLQINKSFSTECAPIDKCVLGAVPENSVQT